jgi:hypothetical protein
MTVIEAIATPPRKSAGAAPLRMPGSARRTSSIDVSWPNVSIHAEPARAALSRLVGERGGGGLRRALEQVVSDERGNATPLPELREKVLAELKGTAGCTHLNDALRALAEVPALVQHLRAAHR